MKCRATAVAHDRSRPPPYVSAPLLLETPSALAGAVTLASLALMTGTREALRGFDTVADLPDLTERHLLSHPRCGLTALRELRAAVSALDVRPATPRDVAGAAAAMRA